MAAPIPKSWLESLLEKCVQKIAAAYTSPILLLLQGYIALYVAGACAYNTKNRSEALTVALTLSFGVGSTYYIFLLIAHDLATALRLWYVDIHRKYFVLLHVLRGIGIIAFLRLFVLFSDALGEVKDLDGLAIATFLSLYLHAVTVLKIFGIHDEFCVSDNLLATAIMLMAKLEKHATLIHLPRTVLSYVAAVLLVFFRFSTVPYERQVRDEGNAELQRYEDVRNAELRRQEDARNAELRRESVVLDAVLPKED